MRGAASENVSGPGLAGGRDRELGGEETASGRWGYAEKEPERRGTETGRLRGPGGGG
jgi:hypothetical protein